MWRKRICYEQIVWLKRLSNPFRWVLGSLVVPCFFSLRHHSLYGVLSSFFIATFLLKLLPDVARIERPQTKKWSLIMEGWQTIHQTPVLKVAARMDLLESMAGAVWVAAILLVFVEEALQAPSQWWGYLNGIFYWHDDRQYDLF